MAVIELKNVCKSYGDGLSRKDVLNGIDLKVKEGELSLIHI